MNEYDIREICLMNELRDSWNICAKAPLHGRDLSDWRGVLAILIPWSISGQEKNALELEK